MRPAGETVYIVVLNWNRWDYTIECLESLHLLRDIEYVIVVCDNGSSDDSLSQLRAWARGDIPARRTALPSLVQEGGCPKPIGLLELKANEIGTRMRGRHRVVLIENGANLGFAGGNNVGISYAMCHDDCAFIWILNNDTVVDPGAARALVDAFKSEPRLGMCGSQIRFYTKPNVIQAFGGTLNRLFCTTINLSNGEPAQSVTRAPAHIDFVPGSSMMVSRAFTEKVGLMAEDYFIYFEEIDWAERGRANFKLSVAPKSIVYHRGGSTIGSPRERGVAGIRSEYFLLRNRLVFARKFFPRTTLIVAGGLVVSTVKRLGHGEWRRAGIAASALFGLLPAALKEDDATKAAWTRRTKR